MDKDEKKLNNKIHDQIDHVNESVHKAKDKVTKTTNGIINKIKNFFMKIGIFVVIAICFVIGIKTAYAYGQRNPISNADRITDIHIEEKLTAIGELSTYSFEYTNEKRVENSKKLFNWSIPGTKNKIDIFYSGVIKVGYEIAEIDCDVNERSKKIFVTIPEIKVLDNYIKLDSLICQEENNVLNPIVTAEVLSYFKNIEEEELAIAEKKGIYESAEEQLKVLIEALFADFSDYAVVFKN